jgi:dienelactone hydrolase
MSMNLLALLLLSCAAQDTIKTRSAALKFEDSEPALKSHESPAAEFQFTLAPGEERKKHKRFRVEFPSAIRTNLEANNSVPGSVWVPVQDQAAPGLVLVHFLGGNHSILESVAVSLARQGIASILFELPFYGPRNGGTGRKAILEGASPDDLVKFMRQAISDVRRARDVLAAVPGVDSGRIGLLGVSLGALIGAATAGIDPTFHRVILVVGGGDLARILFHGSDETRPIKEKFEKEGFDQARAREHLKEVDPLTFASRLPAERCLLIHMKSDEVIPRECADGLADRIGKPRRIWHEGTHKWVGLYVLSIIEETRGFVLGDR